MPPDTPTRLAFCITDLDPGGAERALVQIVTRLDRAVWQPAVFALSGPGRLVETLQQADIPTTCLGARGSRDIAVVWRLTRALRQFRPALLQTFLFHANLAGRLAACLAGVPHVVSGIRVAEKRTRTHLWLDRITNRLVDTNVCVSEAVARFSAETAQLKREKLVVIPNGVDFDTFAQALSADYAEFDIPAGSRMMISVGRLDPQKGLLYLLEAAEAVCRDFDDVHFLLVGEGPERSNIEAEIARAKLTQRIHLAGWRGDVPRLLRGAFCLVLPSLWEGMPNVVLEAMAAGLPVVASRVEGTAETILEGATGITVPPAAADELASALRSVLGNPSHAMRMGQAGQKRAREEFSWELAVARYEALYRRILDQ